MSENFSTFLFRTNKSLILLFYLNTVINEEENSILFYSLPSDKVIRSFHLGRPSDEFDNVI